MLQLMARHSQDGMFIAGRYSYDVDPDYMWLERAGVKKYVYRIAIWCLVKRHRRLLGWVEQ